MNASDTPSSDSPENQPSSAESSTEKSSLIRRIKIGSERAPITSYQQMKAAAEAPPKETPKETTSPPPEQAPVAETPVAEAPPVAPQAKEDEEEKESPRAKRGPPQNLNTPALPRPSVRDKLSPELEAELEAALGGQSIDDILEKENKRPLGVPLLPETKVKAKVLKYHRDAVFLDLGGSDQGLLSLKQLGEKLPEEGATIEVIVDRFDEGEGYYLVHKPGGAVASADWSQLTEGLVVETRITGHNKGGLECMVGNVRGFIPVSHVSLYRVEQLDEFVNQKFNCLITECNPDKRNLVLSRRSVLEREKEEARQQRFATLKVGDVVEGTVRNLLDFGAFIDMDGVDALLHIGQLSWARIKHPSELLTVGQRVKVKVLKIDPDTHKIAVTMRELNENPWSKVPEKYAVGALLKGKVSRIMQFGAFVELEPGVEGMVHISELSFNRVFRVTDVLKEGQEIDVQVLGVDMEKQRISLSYKATLAKVEPEPAAPEEPEEPETPPPPPKKRNVPLKGGLKKGAGGEDIGLYL